MCAIPRPPRRRRAGPWFHPSDGHAAVSRTRRGRSATERRHRPVRGTLTSQVPRRAPVTPAQPRTAPMDRPSAAANRAVGRKGQTRSDDIADAPTGLRKFMHPGSRRGDTPTPPPLDTAALRTVRSVVGNAASPEASRINAENGVRWARSDLSIFSHERKGSRRPAECFPAVDIRHRDSRAGERKTARRALRPAVKWNRSPRLDPNRRVAPGSRHRARPRALARDESSFHSFILLPPPRGCQTKFTSPPFSTTGKGGG